MEPYNCPSSSETSTKNQIADEVLPAWSGGTEEIPTESIIIDIVTGDELLIPCSSSDDDDEMTPSMKEEEEEEEEVNEEEDEVICEMINVGLQKFVSTTDHQDSAARSKSLCIYKVEQNLKKVHEESTFHPKLISIGPFHHNKSDHLKLMEQHKWRFFFKFLKSMNLTSSSSSPSSSSTTTTDHDDMTKKKKQCLVSAMKKLEAKARACYSSESEMASKYDELGSKEFVMMMLLDGCFIIQFLLLFKKSGRNARSNVDSIFSWRSRLPHLRHDLLLLENQLPFFVLQKIFKISGINNKRYRLTDLILDFFNPVLSREKKVLHQCKKAIFHSTRGHFVYRHLLELFMSSFTRNIRGRISIRCISYFPEHIPNYGRHQDISIHCVTELREAGVEFKKRDDHHDLLDIEFKNGKLHIPTLFIDGNTVPVLLNFIAYEQCHHSVKPYFTSYLMFLDYLVNSSKDVEHLHYKGIINHGLGSDEEVATVFNMLCSEIVLDLGDDNYLSQVFIDVNRYFGKRRNRWRAAWKHEYFRNPWTFSSFLAAIILLVLTLLQTYCSMYAYFHPI